MTDRPPAGETSADGNSSDGPAREDAADAAEPLLELDGVVAGYGDLEVLHGVSFAVEKGEIAALVGRNGAGKTTTLRAILGTIRPTAGSITFQGEKVTDRPPEETARRGVSIVPEERRIFPELTVRENLEIAKLGGADDPKHELSVEEVFELFSNLRDRQTNHGSALSGGEQQMLAIGRALVAGVDLLLLDEPTEGLAPQIVRDVVDIVGDLNDRGITVLLVEQNAHVALELSDTAFVMDRGEIVFDGDADDLAADDSLLDEYLGVTT